MIFVRRVLPALAALVLPAAAGYGGRRLRWTRCAELVSALRARVRSWDVTQEAAAARLSDLMRGKLGKFSLDALVSLAAAAGLALEIRVADAA